MLKRTKVELLIYLKSPLLSIDSEVSAQVICANFLAFCFSCLKYKFANKGKQRIILKISKYIHFSRILTFNFCKSFRIWVECTINRTQKLVRVSHTSLLTLSHSTFWSICLYIVTEFISFAWNIINFRLRVSFVIIKLNLYKIFLRFSYFFS